MDKIRFERELPLRHEVDVFVAGGGPAGCAAAVAAARAGASVYLVDSQTCLGGLGTAGMVPAYMCFGDGETFLAAALGREILDRLWAMGEKDEYREHTYSIKAELLKRVYEEMLLEAGVKFSLATTLIDVESDGQNVKHCLLSGKSGLWAARAKVYVDCTGDADLAAWAGVPFDKGDEQGNMMAGTLCSLWAGIDWTRVQGPHNARIEEAYRDGVFSRLDMHLPGMWKITDHIGGGNIGHAFGVDGTDEASLTKALIDMRRLYDEYEAYYKRYLAGFEHMELVATASMMGIRETRRIRGEYTLSLPDFINQANFEDEIGRYCYNVDIHASDDSKKSYDSFLASHTGYRYKKGQNYGVPYRILVPQKIDNLLVAGRCVSTDRPMQSSIRVMPGCYITGQAAGVAAALCAKDGVLPRRADVKKIQKRLLEMGMYLPNFQA